MPYFQLTDINDKTIRSTDFASRYLVMSFLSATGSESRETVQVLKKEFEKVNKDSVQFYRSTSIRTFTPSQPSETTHCPGLQLPKKELGIGYCALISHSVCPLQHSDLTGRQNTNSEHCCISN